MENSTRNEEESRRKVAEAKAKLAAGLYDRPFIIGLAAKRLSEALLEEEKKLRQHKRAA